MRSKFKELEKYPNDEILKALQDSNARGRISLEARNSLATLYVELMEAKK